MEAKRRKKNGDNEIKKAVLHSLQWTFLVFLISLSPIIFVLFYSTLLTTHTFSFVSTINDGSLLFISISGGGASYIDYMYASNHIDDIQSIKLIHVGFLIIFLVAFANYAAIHIAGIKNINSNFLLCYTIGIFLFSFIYACAVKSILFLSKSKNNNK